MKTRQDALGNKGSVPGSMYGIRITESNSERIRIGNGHWLACSKQPSNYLKIPPLPPNVNVHACSILKVGRSCFHHRLQTARNSKALHPRA